VQLLQLDDPFTHEEIEVVIRHVPPNHAPWPDGFNGLFIKKCWNIIKDDFHRLYRDFADGNLNLVSTNDSLITLIPKIVSPLNVHDCWRISILNSIKLFTKILANRLQVVTLQIVHTNQYGFIKGRALIR
jgi:hypothetical protein